MLEVRLFGELSLCHDGKVLALPVGQPARRLLAWLALHPGPQPRARVGSALWPGGSSASARNNVKAALSTLRRALPDTASLLIADDGAVGLRPEALWTDVTAFDQRVRGGRWAEALALVAGPLLPDSRDPWAEELRDELREREAIVLARLEVESEERGDLDSALELARRRRALNPLDEDACIALVRFLLATGREDEAVIEFVALERDHERAGAHFEPSGEFSQLVASSSKGAEATLAGDTGRLREAARTAGVRLPGDAVRSYRWDSHLTAPEEDDPHPDYALQSVRISYATVDLPERIAFVCIASEEDDALMAFSGYQFRWLVDSALNPLSARVFAVGEVRVDGLPLSPHRQRRLELPAGVTGNGCEVAYPIPDELRAGLRSIDMVAHVRLYTGRAPRFTARAMFFRAVTDAEFRLSVDPDLRPERITVGTTGVSPLGKTGPYVYGPTFADRNGSATAMAQFRFPLQRLSEVSFEISCDAQPAHAG